MRKTLLLLLLCLTSFNLSAAPKDISLDFRDATLLEVAQSVIKGVLAKNYIISPDLQNQGKRITLSLNNVTPDEAFKHVNSVLNDAGIYVNDRDGILYLENSQGQPVEASSGTASPSPEQLPPEPQPQSVYVYSAKHRPLNGFKSLFSTTGTSVVVDQDIAVISGDSMQVETVKTLLSHYDRPLDELELKISVVEYQASSDNAKSLSASLTALSGQFGLKFGSNDRLRDGLTFTGVDFNLVMSVIENNSNFSILDTSMMRVVSGKSARINVGQEVPVLSQFSQDNNGRNYQSVQYRPSGLIVDVKPVLISGNVHSEVSQQLSSFAVTSTSSINSPTLLKRELVTNLNVPLDTVIIMGGLEEFKTTKARNSLFGIPLGSQDSVSKVSLLLVLEFTRR